MDPSAFDTLSRSFATTRTRRRLVSLLLALPLGGVLTTLGGDEAAADRPLGRVQQRTQQRNRKQRNRKNNNTKNNTKNNKNAGGGSSAFPCVPIDQLCSIVSPNRCCGKAVCFATLDPFIATCRAPCVEDPGICQKEFGVDVECVDDIVACGVGSPCCRPKVCGSNLDCQGGGPCCGTLPLLVKRCCAQGQVCATFGGCATP